MPNPKYLRRPTSGQLDDIQSLTEQAMEPLRELIELYVERKSSIALRDEGQDLLVGMLADLSELNNQAAAAIEEAHDDLHAGTAS
jgi:hypothetical protein